MTFQRDIRANRRILPATVANAAWREMISCDSPVISIPRLARAIARRHYRLDSHIFARNMLATAKRKGLIFHDAKTSTWRLADKE